MHLARMLAPASILAMVFSIAIAQATIHTMSADQIVDDHTSPEDPLETLRTFQSYCVKSGTIYLHHDVMQKALEQTPEFVAWHLKPSDDPAAADLAVEITLPFLSWEWTYNMVHQATGRLLATGKVKALEEHQAAPLLAAAITKKIQSARGAPEVQVSVAPMATRAQAVLKKWHVKGATGPLQDKDLTLSIGGESISVAEQSGQALEIPTPSVLSAYHTSYSDNREKSRQRRKSWDGGWEEVCEKTSSGEGCLAVLGLPIWLIGDAILMIPGPSSHFVVVRWQDDHSVNELSFQVRALDWKDILRDLQAAVPNDGLSVTADVHELRKEFDEAKHRDLKIWLASTVTVGRWPLLEAGGYRIVLVERSEARAEVFFFALADTQFDRPRAVAAAHLNKVLARVTTPTVTFREKDGVRLINEIRADYVLLSFD